MREEARFLLVEGDPATAGALVRFVRRNHFGQTVVTSTTVHALSVLRDAAPWAGFIIDVALPDGLDLLASARAGAHSITPAVVLTSDARAQWINRAFELGARCLIKPIRPDALAPFFHNVTSFSRHVETTLQSWRTRHSLSDAEADVLRRAVLGEDRKTIAAARGTSELTVKRQVADMLRATKDACLHVAVERLLREVAQPR